MKNSSIALIGFLIVAVIAMAFGVTAHWYHSSSKFTDIDGAKLTAAIHGYSRDMFIHKKPLPKSISLDELIEGGYLSRNDVRAFDGLKVTFFTDANETVPQSVLVEALFPDGSAEVVLADGSVQQYSAIAMQAAKKNHKSAK